MKRDRLGRVDTRLPRLLDGDRAVSFPDAPDLIVLRGLDFPQAVVIKRAFGPYYTGRTRRLVSGVSVVPLFSKAEEWRGYAR